MKKLCTGIIVSLLIVAIFNTQMINTKTSLATEPVRLIVSDDFESYDVGTIPSTWKILVGADEGLEKSTDVQVMDSHYYSPTKSLYIRGVALFGGIYAVTAVKEFDSDARFLANEFQFSTDTPGKIYLSFWSNGLGRVTSVWYEDGEIYVYNSTDTSQIVLQKTVGEEWYKILVIVDRQTSKYSVWVNDALKVKNLNTDYNASGRINSIWMTSGGPNAQFWLDDVRIFEGLQQPFVNRKPYARLLANSTTVKEGRDVVRFNASTSYDLDGTVSSYWFDYGDGTNSSWTKNPIQYKTYKNGTYYAKVKVKDNLGLESNWSSQVTITVLPNKKPIARLSVNSTTIKEGDTVKFNASLSSDYDGKVTSYFFDYGDGTNSGWTNESVKLKQYMSAGTYYAKVKVKDDFGLESDWSSQVKITVMTPPPLQQTDMELIIIDREKWYTNLDVPFNIPDAEQYVKDAVKNGKPAEEPFGNISLNIEVRNIGNRTAENVVVNVTIAGFVVLARIDEKDVYKDMKFPFYSFEPYATTQTIGSMNAMTPKSVELTLPVKFMSVVVGELTFKTNENIEMPLEILFTIVELHVSIKVSGDNFQSVEGSTKAFGLGDPKKILEKWNEALRERLKRLQEDALEDLLKRRVAESTLTLDTEVYSDIGVGIYRHDTTVKIPETTTLVISAILPVGIALKELSVALGSTVIPIGEHAMSGFGMIVISDLDKLVPKGTVTAAITLETISSSAVAVTAYKSDQVNTTLTVIKVMNTSVQEEPRFDYTMVIVGAIIAVCVALAVTVVVCRRKRKH